MILVTGGTGFIGQALVQTLVSLGYPVRLLLNPSADYPKLPRNVAVEVAISGMDDERNLRAAMKGVDTVFHLIGTDRDGIDADYENVDVKSATVFSRVAAQMKVKRFFFLSHLGADKDSAYNYLRSKALCEAAIKESGVPYTIIRTALVFGRGDHFTEVLAAFARRSRTLLIPGGDQTLVQPIWVEDLVTCLLLCMDDPESVYSTIEIGGGETLSFQECMNIVMNEIGVHRRVMALSAGWLRSIYIAIETWFPNYPRLYFWLDYLAEDRIVPLDILPRYFGLMPTRMSRAISYLSREE